MILVVFTMLLNVWAERRYKCYVKRATYGDVTESLSY